jgi:crotonobetainyl-CoA:carnitine CoA-transferase CaiB-like acyl-CoA transferase
VLELLGVGHDPRFTTFEGRAEHREELDDVVASWIGARSSDEVLTAFEEAHAAIAPVYSMRDLLEDPHVKARRVFVEVDGVVMQGPAARLSKTPAHIRWPGRPFDADTLEVLNELERSPATRPEEAL